MKKNKKLLIIFMLVGIALVSSGCSGKDSVKKTGDKNTIENRFLQYDDRYAVDGVKMTIIVDLKTNIVYLRDGSLYGGGISPLYNADGYPMTVEEYEETR